MALFDMQSDDDQSSSTQVPPPDQSPAARFIASIGAKALASGQMSPKEALAHLQTLPPAFQSSLSKVDPNSSPANLMQSPGGGGQPTSAPPPTMGLGQNAHASKTSLDKDVSGGKSTTQKYLTDDPTKFAQFNQAVENTPEFQDQKDAVNKLQNLLDMNAEYQKATPKMDWSPLLALADAQTGSKLAQSYTPPATGGQNVNQNIKGQQDLITDKQAMSKDLLSAATALKSGNDQTNYLKTFMNSNTAGFGNPNGGGSLANSRLMALIPRAGQDFDNDKVLNSMVGTVNNLNRADSIMKGNTPVNVQMFNDLQADLKNAISPGGAATEGGMNRALIQTVDGYLNNLQQKFGNVQDLRKEQPQIFAQLQSFLDQVKNEYTQAGAQRLAIKEANWRQVPLDPVQKTVDAKLDKYGKFFGVSPDQTADPFAQHAVAPGTHPDPSVTHLLPPKTDLKTLPAGAVVVTPKGRMKSLGNGQFVQDDSNG